MIAKYYNADTLLEFVKQNTPHIDGQTTMQCVERAILETPTADVVEVVRCKDCKYYIANYCTRDINGRTNMFYMNADDFCSYGERKQ